MTRSNPFRSFSTRGSYSTVQAKFPAQLLGADRRLGIVQASFRNLAVFDVRQITLQNEFADVIRYRHARCLCIGEELRLDLVRNFNGDSHDVSCASDLQ